MESQVPLPKCHFIIHAQRGTRVRAFVTSVIMEIRNVVCFCLIFLQNFKQNLVNCVYRHSDEVISRARHTVTVCSINEYDAMLGEERTWSFYDHPANACLGPVGASIHLD